MPDSFRVSIFGVYPSPGYLGLGGVSVHVYRLAERLNQLGILENMYNSIYVQKEKLIANKLVFNKKNIQEVYNVNRSDYVVLIRSLRNNQLTTFYWFVRYAVFDKSIIFHFHNHLEYALEILLLNKVFNKRIVITIHDQMQLSGILNKRNGYFITYFLLKIVNSSGIIWIAVSHNIKNQLISIGVKSDNIKVIPAYIKSNSNEPIGTELLNFIESHFPVLTVYAVGTSLHNDEDLYGIDLALELINKLSDEFSSIGLVVVIPGTKKSEIMESYYRYIRENDLTGHVYIQTQGLKDLNGLFKKSHIYLRPTNTDGDALAIREALAAECIVVASDVVQRPSGSVLFKNRHSSDLYVKVYDVLNNLDEYKNRIPRDNDFFDQIISVYKS